MSEWPDPHRDVLEKFVAWWAHETGYEVTIVLALRAALAHIDALETRVAVLDMRARAAEARIVWLLGERGADPHWSAQSPVCSVCGERHGLERVCGGTPTS